MRTHLMWECDAGGTDGTSGTGGTGIGLDAVGTCGSLSGVIVGCGSGVGTDRAASSMAGMGGTADVGVRVDATRSLVGGIGGIGDTEVDVVAVGTSGSPLGVVVDRGSGVRTGRVVSGMGGMADMGVHIDVARFVVGGKGGIGDKETVVDAVDRQGSLQRDVVDGDSCVGTDPVLSGTGGMAGMRVHIDVARSLVVGVGGMGDSSHGRLGLQRRAGIGGRAADIIVTRTVVGSMGGMGGAAFGGAGNASSGSHAHDSSGGRGLEVGFAQNACLTHRRTLTLCTLFYKRLAFWIRYDMAEDHSNLSSFAEGFVQHTAKDDSLVPGLLHDALEAAIWEY